MTRRLLTAILLLAAALPAVAQQKPSNWGADLDFVVQQIKSVHPNPYRRIPEKDFGAAVARLRHDLPKLNDDERAVRLMQLVASLRDEHTALFPAGEQAWFPVRFYRFTDGLFVTAVDKRFAQIAGAKVLRIGDVSAEEACRRAETAFSSDNPSAALDAPVLLSSARVVRGLHIAGGATLPLRVRTRAGEEVSVELPAVTQKGDFEFYQWGEMFGPINGLVTAFGGRDGDGYLNPDANGDLPLHLRGRRAYWGTYVPDQRMLYLQLNAIAAQSKRSKETMPELLQRLFATREPVEYFVLDLRYNSGGNGALVDSFVHEFIKRDTTIARRGHLFLLVGRKTYSAAADLARQMMRHTAIATIGEPMGSAPNGSGDPDDATLPFSGMHFQVSTNYFIGATSKDMSWEIPVEFPAQFSSEEYFAGKDPALAVVLDPAAHADLIDVLQQQGGKAAWALYEARKARLGSISWWQPFEREKLNRASYELLEAGRKEDAVAGFEIVVDRYPDRWEPWDSLAEGLMGAGRYREGIAAYRKAMALSPNNFNLEFQKKSIAKMEAELAKR